MTNGKELPSTLEWRVHAPDGTAVEILVQEESGTSLWRLFSCIHGLVVAFVIKLSRFFIKAWNIGVHDPRKFIHCLKVGTALSLVSLFYYMRTLYQGVGGNAMWAVMTVVVVFEYSIGNSYFIYFVFFFFHSTFLRNNSTKILLITVGATLYKCVNRATGTLLAGSLGFGVHWIAIQCGQNIQPIILEISVFLLGTLNENVTKPT